MLEPQPNFSATISKRIDSRSIFACINARLHGINQILPVAICDRLLQRYDDFVDPCILSNHKFAADKPVAQNTRNHQNGKDDSRYANGQPKGSLLKQISGAHVGNIRRVYACAAALWQTACQFWPAAG